MEKRGKLTLIPTPIGNLGDMTFRAVQLLGEADIILTEDTRTSGKLLAHYDIKRPTRSYHMHNEHAVTASLVKQIASGEHMALITDAGTPGVSDPGYLLVAACLENGIPVEVLPGPTAFLPALIKSGFPNDRFIFEGFLPHKKGRKKRISEWKEESRTVVVYESPHRIVKLLEQICELLGDNRPVSVSRELTKKFEETLTGTARELLVEIDKNPRKGEFVVVIGRKTEKT